MARISTKSSWTRESGGTRRPRGTNTTGLPDLPRFANISRETRLARRPLLSQLTLVTLWTYIAPNSLTPRSPCESR